MTNLSKSKPSPLREKSLGIGLNPGQLWRSQRPSTGSAPMLLLLLNSSENNIEIAPVTFAGQRGSPGFIYLNEQLFGVLATATIWLPLRVLIPQKCIPKILDIPITLFNDLELISWLKEPIGRSPSGTLIDVEPVDLFDNVYERQWEIEDELNLLVNHKILASLEFWKKQGNKAQK